MVWTAQYGSGLLQDVAIGFFAGPKENTYMWNVFVEKLMEAGAVFHTCISDRYGLICLPRPRDLLACRFTLVLCVCHTGTVCVVLCVCIGRQ